MRHRFRHRRRRRPAGTASGSGGQPLTALDGGARDDQGALPQQLDVVPHRLLQVAAAGGQGSKGGGMGKWGGSRQRAAQLQQHEPTDLNSW